MVVIDELSLKWRDSVPCVAEARRMLPVMEPRPIERSESEFVLSVYPIHSCLSPSAVFCNATLQHQQPACFREAPAATPPSLFSSVASIPWGRIVRSARGTGWAGFVDSRPACSLGRATRQVTSLIGGGVCSSRVTCTSRTRRAALGPLTPICGRISRRCRRTATS